MEKIDLRKQYKELYSPSKSAFSLVQVPALQYLMIDGSGDPNHSQRYQDAIQTLYGLSYTLKFDLKKTQGIDYTVMGLEGLWWEDNLAEFSMEHKERWHWTAMILQPEFITAELVEGTRQKLAGKGKAPLAGETRLQVLEEGLCAQILYIGAYDDEPPTIARMHAFIHEQGYELHGIHHEIYLSDARRVAPEKLRTILRQPMKKQG